MEKTDEGGESFCAARAQKPEITNWQDGKDVSFCAKRGKGATYLEGIKRPALKNGFT